MLWGTLVLVSEVGDSPIVYGGGLFTSSPSLYREWFVMHYADGRKFTCKVGEFPEHWRE